MKNLLVILLLLCMQTGFTQIQKGTVVVGGGLSLGGSSIKDDAYNDSDYKNNSGSFNLNGRFEKFLNERTALGFGVSYSLDNSTYSNDMYDYGSRIHLINVGAGISNYIPIVEKLYFNIESYVSFGIGGRKDKSNDEKYGIWTAGINANPGIVFFLNDKWALDAGIGSLYYNFQSEKPKEENASGERPKESRHRYGLNFSANTFSIGLRYFLRTASSN